MLKKAAIENSCSELLKVVEKAPKRGECMYVSCIGTCWPNKAVEYIFENTDVTHAWLVIKNYHWDIGERLLIFSWCSTLTTAASTRHKGHQGCDKLAKYVDNPSVYTCKKQWSKAIL